MQPWHKVETRYRSSIPTHATETLSAAAQALPVLLAKFTVTSLRTEPLSAPTDTSTAPSTTTFRWSYRRNRPLLLRNVVVDRKSTRLNSSHTVISYAVFCLKK